MPTNKLMPKAESGQGRFQPATKVGKTPPSPEPKSATDVTISTRAKFFCRSASGATRLRVSTYQASSEPLFSAAPTPCSAA